MDDSATTGAGRLSIAIIGAGALGTALAGRLQNRGYAIEAVISRNAADAERLGGEVNAVAAGDTFDMAPPEVNLIFCCVPDDALASLAFELAVLPRAWSKMFVAHTSGVHTSAALAPVQEQGAATMSFHPLQTFTLSTPPEAFENIYIGIEGAPRALHLGKRIAVDLGARPLELSPDAKVRYHLAATLSSNFFVTLMHMSDEVLASAGINDISAADLMRPLIEQTWNHLREASPTEALTGPISRGDAGTIEQHLDALQEHLPHLLPAYRALAEVSVRIAKEGGLRTREARILMEALFRR